MRATKHDHFIENDFAQLAQLGIRTVRTGARWHLIEQTERTYNFESLEPCFSAAAGHGIEILLDLFHFGWPDGLDIFGPSFVPRFRHYVRAVAGYLREWKSVCHMVAPVNEISFLSWAGGDVAALNPFERGRGAELKRILVSAFIAGSEVLLNEVESIRLISPEPVIHIVGDPSIPGDEQEAEAYRLAQFEAWDMISGRLAPELGGRPEFLDIIGANFYDRNEWTHNSEPILPDDPRYRPFHQILTEIWERYRRPLFVSETGTEDEARSSWFKYITSEVVSARRNGVPVSGVCLYPILNHPGWDDERHCQNGLFDYADSEGNRAAFQPLLNEIISFQNIIQRSPEDFHDYAPNRFDLPFPSPMGFRVATSAASDESLRA
ncbi:MAG: beta-glucosidase [Bryobacteraceae bacterium]